jgi:hypothetical protein
MAENKSLVVNLYLLERDQSTGPDEYSRMVVAACTEKQAREIANQESKAEGYVWSDGTITSVKIIGSAEDGVNGVVIATKE